MFASAILCNCFENCQLRIPGRAILLPLEFFFFQSLRNNHDRVTVILQEIEDDTFNLFLT